MATQGREGRCDCAPDALLTRRPLAPATNAPELECFAPAPPLMRISSENILFGVEGKTPRRIQMDALRSALDEVKRQRLDREVVYIEVVDGVSFDRLAAAAAGFNQRRIFVDPTGRVLDEAAWARPIYRSTASDVPLAE